MTKALKFLAALLLAVPLFAQAQQRTYSQPELDQMLAPVALYPDALLSQVLMAATYPDEVDEAARWSAVNPGLQGDTAVQAVRNDGWDWDPSVQSLVAFPQILARMRESPGWTRSLGEAFLAQEPQVMETVQQLRRRAQAAGNLRSGEQFSVQQQDQVIVVQPASPYYVTVPYYDPLVVYGPWWWPTYRPVVWTPWPRAYPVHVSLGFFFGNFDWHRHQVRVAHPTVYYYRRPVIVNQTVVVAPHRWQHEPRRRAAVIERRAAQVRPQVQVQPVLQRPAARVESRPVVAVQAKPTVAPQQRIVQRDDRRAERQAAQRQAQQPARQAERATMPAAQAPQQPRAERQEQREERREKRQEQRKDRAKG